jgi:hypothetical protein
VSIDGAERKARRRVGDLAKATRHGQQLPDGKDAHERLMNFMMPSQLKDGHSIADAAVEEEPMNRTQNSDGHKITAIILWFQIVTEADKLFRVEGLTQLSLLII